MTLGSRDELDAQLTRVEKYGYKRDYFPLTWNGHNVILLVNDSYETDDKRIHLHLTLYCAGCFEEHGIRGTIEPASSEHLQIIKLIPLGYFYLNDCQ